MAKPKVAAAPETAPAKKTVTVENEYDEETAEPCDHGITVREFADIDALNAEMRS